MVQTVLPTFETEDELSNFISQFKYDAFGFVMAVFPWGEKGSSLENRKGPSEWQAQLLRDLSKFRRDNVDITAMGLAPLVWRSAVVSGHGVGKSAVVSWIIYWLMSTSPDLRGVVTANTGDQLEKITWPELAKWHDIAINKHWFKLTATAICFALYPEEKQKNYMVSARTVSKDRTEAFAGLHNEGKTILVIFDEASAIDTGVWEVVEGAMTDGECFFLCFGNPTRADGEFRKCFREYASLYHRYHIDSRDVEHTNKMELENIIRKYGIDSDVVKVRILGQFPDRSYDGFISESVFNSCVTRDSIAYNSYEPLILGVDVAGQGNDATVLFPRRGYDARSLPRIRIRKAEPEVVARAVAEWARKYKPDAIIMENIGPSQGVMSVLKMWNIKVISAAVGAPSTNPVFRNVRAEIWDKMLTWMIEGGCLRDDPELFKQATDIKYTLQGDGQKQQMESKKDIKARTGESPDDMDALALTFYAPVKKRNRSVESMMTEEVFRYDTDYNMIGF